MCFPLGEQPVIHLNQSNKNRTPELQHADLIMSHETQDEQISLSYGGKQKVRLQ